jgi:hypothetical protein
MNKTLDNGLPIYKSLSELSTSNLVDIVNVFILPLIAINSLITNLLCMIVFSNKFLFQHSTYKYLFYVSFSDFMFSLINSLIGIMRCGSLCSYGYNYWLKCYEIYVFLFVGRVFEVSGLLVDIKLSVSRLFAFKNRSLSQNNKKIERFKSNILVTLLIGSIVMGSYSILSKQPRLFGYLNNNINQTDSIELYSIGFNSIGNIDYIKHIVTAMLVFKGIILLNILSIINLIVFFKYRSHMNKKLNFKLINHRQNKERGQLKNKKELKTTLLIILICLWRYLGDLQNSIVAISFTFVSQNTFNILTIITNGIQWTVIYIF